MNILQSNNTLIALILICLVVGIYSYYANMPIELKDLKTIKGELVDKPKLIEQGEGMQYYFIELRLKDNNKRFYFKNCAYNLVNDDSVLKLAPGLHIELTVNRYDYEDKEKLDIYSFSIKEKEDILSLDDYNSCHVNYWKKIMPFIVILIGLLLYRILLRKELIGKSVKKP